MSYSVQAGLVANSITGFRRTAQVNPWSAACHFAIERIKRKVSSSIKVPLHPADLIFMDLHGKHRAEAVPPETNCFVADNDATFMQQILHIPERQREPDIHHHCQADDFGRRLEVAKWRRFCHPPKLRGCPARLNQFCSDNAKPIKFFLIFPFHILDKYGPNSVQMQKELVSCHQ